VNAANVKIFRPRRGLKKAGGAERRRISGV
jgi:hypothetical protein